MTTKTCGECRYSWAIGASQQKPTVFDYITQNIETLAKNSTYFRVSRDGEHYTFSSPWIDTVHETEEEAIAATVEELKKEVKEDKGR